MSLAYKSGFIFATALVLVGFFTQRHQQDSLYFQVKDFPELMDLVQKAYVDEVDLNDMMGGAFQGALENVDPGASYIPNGVPASNLADKVFKRYGIFLTKRESYGFIAAVMPGSPAEQAGFQPGEILTRVGPLTTRTSSNYQVREWLIKATEPIDCTVFTAQEEKEIMLKPGAWTRLPNASSALEGDTLFIQLPIFTGDLATWLPAELKRFPQAQKIVLDLRHNCLGQPEALQVLADLFFKSGPIGSIQGPHQSMTMAVQKDGAFADFPLVVWVNASTSGSAEAFACLAKRQKRALLLGENTLGLPNFYELIPLKSQGYLELSTRAYHILGDPIGNKGVTVDRILRQTDRAAVLAELGS
ncbi:MAG: hypothetical protein H6510_01425 [Acidobacteria bacterium]|nr:hypothetical protein [Acidobacteriota bacterium]MCB9396451.1 hypothetical protein [Acidobacteriota bacterium]